MPVDETKGAEIKFVFPLVFLAWHFPCFSADEQVKFLPFEFGDKTLESRSDLKKILPTLPIFVSTETSKKTIEVRDRGVKLFLFQEIAQIFESASRPSDDLALDNPAQTYCATHSEVKPTLLADFDFTLKDTCHVLSKTLNEALKNTGNVCRYVHSPEQFVELQPYGVVRETDMMSIEGLIRVAGEPLQRNHLFPTSLVNAEFINSFRKIILKIRMPTLTERLNQQTAVYVKLHETLSDPNGCAIGQSTSIEKMQKKLGLLMAELDFAKKLLVKTDREGLQQAAIDHQKVVNKNRKRGSLPFPNMTDAERQMLSMYLGGVYWRIRGGGVIASPDGTRQARKWFNMMAMQSISHLNGGDYARDAGTAIYNRISRGWSEWMDMGRTPGSEDAFHDLAFMTERGRFQVEDLVSFLKSKGYDSDEVAASGLMMGSIYFYSWNNLNIRIGISAKEPFRPLFDGPTAIAEFGVGGVISLALARTLLNGHK